MIKQLEDERCKYMHGQPKLTVEQQFRLLLRMLRKDFPPELPIKVRRMVLPHVHGLCWIANLNKPKAEHYFVIWLSTSDPWATQRYMLLHEWAHALTWFKVREGKDHADIHARKHGALYRAYIEN